MELAKSDMLVLHPLPRVNEIAVGVYARMALILTLLNIEV